MGNIQHQFQSIPPNQHPRLNTTIRPSHHHIFTPDPILSSHRPAPIDQQNLHSTFIRKPSQPPLGQQPPDDSLIIDLNNASGRLQELDYQFYTALALPDYIYPDLPQSERGLQEMQDKDQYGVRYIGQCKNNKLHGNGVLISNTSKYIGQFKNGLKHHHGRQIYKSQVYQGEFQSDQRIGRGVRYTPEKIQEGQFYRDFQYGTITYANNNIYKGKVRNGLYHDPSAYLFDATNQIRYEKADFHEGQLKRAQVYYSNGNTYKGEMMGEAKHGQGVYTWADGSVYRGKYHMDVRHGEGVFQGTKGRKNVKYQFGEEEGRTQRDQVSQVSDLPQLWKDEGREMWRSQVQRIER